MNKNATATIVGNEPAFPCPVGHIECYHPTGLTKRQWYAGMALQGCINLSIESRKSGSEVRSPEDIAHWAFETADAMLKQDSI